MLDVQQMIKFGAITALEQLTVKDPTQLDKIIRLNKLLVLLGDSSLFSDEKHPTSKGDYKNPWDVWGEVASEYFTKVADGMVPSCSWIQMAANLKFLIKTFCKGKPWVLGKYCRVIIFNN